MCDGFIYLRAHSHTHNETAAVRLLQTRACLALKEMQNLDFFV